MTKLQNILSASAILLHKQLMERYILHEGGHKVKKYVCSICGYVYDEAAGIPAAGIGPGTRWEDLPEGWVCPLCGASKDLFNPVDAAKKGRKMGL